MHHRLFSSSFLFMITLFMYFGISSSLSQNGDNRFNECSLRFECGLNKNIKYPFWGNGRTQACGRPGFELKNCQDDYPVIEIMEEEYRLLSIDQDENILTIVRLDIWDDGGACPDKFVNTSLDDSLFDFVRNYHNLTFLYNCSPQFPEPAAYKVKCSINGSSGEGFYVKEPTQNLQIQSCKDIIRVPVLRSSLKDLHQLSIQKVLKKGFNVKYKYDEHACSACDKSGGQCGSHLTAHNFMCFCPDDQPTSWDCSSDTSKTETHKSRRVVMLATGISTALIGLVVVIYCYFKKKFFWKKGMQSHQSLEVFLQNYGSFAPKRYSYSEIKKMTFSFKDKLGQGGYGGVFKGKLHDGCLVAVKVLNKSKGDGEEFINEVVSICRTSHVNIVTLLGFCFEGSKRALIYEFMPNGSLEKFIYENPLRENHQLEWETLYQIAIGIARGLEYLHRGCKTRILHFDIKPHNILLDEDFCPKISDFGLAKLCPKKESIISMLGARGTIGYIAPEVFSRNFGGVSYKSDVYSYGMMILEIVGGRKNIDVSVDNDSEIYFPHWIYKRLEQGNQLGLHGVMNEEENEKARKMILVGLWCIQTDPSNRPSMSRVVEMLQGSLGSLQIPPRPFLSSPPRSPVDSSSTTVPIMTS